MSKLIIKDDAERLVYGEVYVPYRLDSQNEYMTPDEIKKACHRFMERFGPGNVNEEHEKGKVPVRVVESFIVKKGDPDFITDSWVAGAKILSDEHWEKIKLGELNGWSMEGKGQRIPQKVIVKAATALKGETEENLTDDPHIHPFHIRFDENGGVIGSYTDMAENHRHEIKKTTATEEQAGHSHRYDVDWISRSEGVEVEEREQNAVELVNVYPEFLALVKHAAVRRGFKIVKADKSEVKKMDRVVHAVLIKKGHELEEFVEVPGLEFIGDPKVRVRKTYRFEKSDKYVVMPLEDFEPDSIHKVGTEDPNVRLIIGTLQKERDDAVIVKENRKKTREETSMKKEEIIELLDAAIEEKVPKMLQTELETFKGDVIKVLKDSLEGDDDPGDKDKDDDVTDENTLKTDLKKMAKTMADLAKSVEGLADGQKGLVEKSDKLKEDLDKISNSSITRPGSKDADDDVDDVDIKKTDKNENPWAGFFTKYDTNPKIRAILEAD